MGKVNFSKGKFSKFISSKGFYVAIAACLAGAGAATWFAVDRTITGIENNNNQVIESEGQWKDYPELEDVEKKQSAVKKPSSESSSPSSSQSSASSSSGPSKPASEASGKQSSSAASEAASAPSSDKDSAAAGVEVDLPVLSYALPVKGEVIGSFSNGELVKNATLNDWRTHDGLDLAAAKGAEVFAAADGTVKSIASDPLWGTVVTVEHADGNQTIYCGLDQSLPVSNGDIVIARQAIGKLEGVPCEISQDTHLHFAMKRGDEWIDPLTVLQKEITD